jgi:hypothetical protein
MPFATIATSSTARVPASTRATRGASLSRARHVVASAAPSSTSTRDARPTAIVASIAALSLAVAACGAVPAPARAEVTCDWVHPCTPPPPDGKPRYELPGSTYDPAAEAVKRYLERQNQSSSSSAPAVATTTTTTTTSSSTDDRE